MKEPTKIDKFKSNRLVSKRIKIYLSDLLLLLEMVSGVWTIQIQNRTDRRLKRRRRRKKKQEQLALLVLSSLKSSHKNEVPYVNCLWPICSAPILLEFYRNPFNFTVKNAISRKNCTYKTGP